MEKPDVSGILEKVKSGAGDLAEKARIRTTEAAGSEAEKLDSSSTALKMLMKYKIKGKEVFDRVSSSSSSIIKLKK